MEILFRQIIEQIGEDVNREGLKDTPLRAAKAIQHLTRGYRENLEEIINGALFTSDSSDMVIVKDIELYSLCEHHLLPFFGRCHVGYLPNGKVLGLSKVARIVNYFAARLQIQEQLTSEIARCIESITGARGISVVIEARHLCMMMRGVEKQGPVMTTSAMLGELRNNPSTRMEFLNLIKE